MEIFLLFILAVLAIMVLFWLLVFPACLWGAAAFSVLCGALRGVREALKPRL